MEKFSNEVEAALYSGRKIEAIKLLREEKSIGLKEAKELIDSYIESNTELQEKLKQSQAGSSTVFLCIIIVALAYGAYHFFLR